MVRIKSSVETLLNVQPHEGRILSLFFALFFLKGICDVFFATSASTLFLQEYGNQTLPYVYILSALIVTLLGFAYARLTVRFTPTLLLKGTLVFVVISVGALHALMTIAPAKWWAMSLMIWREVLYMVLNATFWAQAGLLFNIRQAKRLFPVIAAGDIASAGLGGLLIPSIVSRIGALHLLFFAEVSIAVCLVVATAIDRTVGTGKLSSGGDVEPDTRSLRQLLRQRYLALFFTVSILSYVIYFFADYNFYDVVNRRYPDAQSLAVFFGVFYGVLNLASLVVNAVIAGRLMLRYGIYVGLLAVPLSVLLGTSGALILPSLFFWAIIGTKLLDEMNRGAFLYPIYKVLYQPLPARERIRVQALRDSVVEPVAVGVSGVLLLVLTRLAGFDVRALCIVLLGVVTAFVLCSMFLRREYVAVLSKALSRRRSMEDIDLLSNSSSIQVLRKGLSSSNAVEVIYCLGLIEEADQSSVAAMLPQLVHHLLPEVREYALQRVRHTRRHEALAAVRDCIRRETSPAVLREALWTVCRLLEAEATVEVLPYLSHDNFVIRSGAIVGLLRHSGISGVLAAGRSLTDLVDSNVAAQRVLAAKILGDVEAANFYEPLARLLNDADPAVVRTALKSTGKVKSPNLLNLVIEKIHEPLLREAAAGALVRFGNACLLELRSALRAAATPQQKMRLIRIVARFSTIESSQMLVAEIGEVDENVRTTVLLALMQQRFSASGAGIDQVRRALHKELEHAAWIAGCVHDIRATPATDLLIRALSNDYVETRDRVLLLLSFICSPRTIAAARTILRYGTEEQRAQALEAVDNLLPRDLRERVLVVLDRMPVPHESGDLKSRLQQLMTQPEFGISHWCRACAIHTAAQLEVRGLETSIEAATLHQSALVRETAANALRLVC